MPIYEYRCPDCGHRFEAMQKFSEDPITVCPSCAAEDVRKLISAPAFHLKGGGWYKDHYGLKSGASSSSSSASAPSPPASSSPTSSSDSSSSDSSTAASASASDSSATSKPAPSSASAGGSKSSSS